MSGSLLFSGSLSEAGSSPPSICGMGANHHADLLGARTRTHSKCGIILSGERVYRRLNQEIFCEKRRSRVVWTGGSSHRQRASCSYNFIPSYMTSWPKVRVKSIERGKLKGLVNGHPFFLPP